MDFRFRFASDTAADGQGDAATLDGVSDAASNGRVPVREVTCR